MIQQVFATYAGDNDVDTYFGVDDQQRFPGLPATYRWGR